MEFIVEKSAFAKVLSHVQSVAERRNTSLILTNILIQAKGDRLRLTATDMELEIVEEAAAEVTTDGVTTVPAVLVHDYVGKIADGAQIKVELDSSGETVSLKCGKSVCQLPTMPVEEFPLMDDDTFTHQFSLEPGVLMSLFDRAKFAISTEETRFYLNGIYFHVTEEGDPVLRAVATDGHRMARLEHKMPEGAAGMTGIIIPRKAILELVRLVDPNGKEITISLNDTKIKFELGDIVLTSKLIHGRFPDYEKVIPRHNDQVMDIDRKTFKQAIARVATVANERTRIVKMTLESGRVKLAAVSNDTGSAEDELIVDYDGDGLVTGYNSRYIDDILGNMDGARVQLIMHRESGPILITNSEDSSALYLLMPLRV